MEKEQPLIDALEWIIDVADMNLQDQKLRSNARRTLRRIADKAEEAISKQEDE